MSRLAELGGGGQMSSSCRRLLLLPPLLSLRKGSPATRCRCVLGGGAAVTTANAIAAAASGGPHAAVGSAIAHVAVTAVAIASGACLSTKVDFLWPRVEQEPDSLIFEGVDVTGYLIFKDVKVQKAIAFASKAHFGQFRKTGEPYVTHCIHTGKILAALVPSTGERAINTVVAGILHDVIDDTIENLNSIEKVFGDDVAHLVAGVSKLSFINQLLRRHRRRSVNRSALTPEEANNLRVMLLGIVDDPRMVLIKLADRLHNMRTIYALSMPKAQAVAEETLAVWCSLASRLGVWALKAELEDLCFAVLQPHIFRKMRSELACMWNPRNKYRNLRKSISRHGPLQVNTSAVPGQNWYASATNDCENLRVLLQAVVPFDLLRDRSKRTVFLSDLKKHSETADVKPKVVTDASVALASLTVCEEALEKELLISTSYIPGMEVTLSSRLKSVYSIYCKMKRKDVGIQQIYDARALRVVVGDRKGTLHGLAVKSCYNLLDIVHRLWTPINGEFDDYIINPKPSGYQSLHTAVNGPDNSPLEVQIRTQRMHEYAEDGLAAHWLYKENKMEPQSTIYGSQISDSSYQTKFAEDESWIEDDSNHGNHKYASIKVGHPVLRIERGQLLTAVVVRVDKGGRELLVAVSFDFEASEEVADRRSPSKKNHWAAYARLYKKVSDEWWFAPGHGDWCTCLEKYTLCRDGIFHKEDQFRRLLPTFIQVIDLTEQEEAEYWMVMSAVLEGKDANFAVSNLNYSEKTSSTSSAAVEDGIHNKVQLLRTMLQWEEQVRHGETLGARISGSSSYGRSTPLILGEVAIIRWPNGEIMRMRSGSTAADAARRVGFEGKIVLVNGQHALPHTELRDGDIVEVRL